LLLIFTSKRLQEYLLIKILTEDIRRKFGRSALS
jgi:hypothetical protein